MSDINNVIIVGRLTDDVKVKSIQGGSFCAEFAIATNYYVSSKKANEVSYLDCVAYGNTAEMLEKYTKKGKQICIGGMIKQERWKDRDSNNTRSRIRIIVNNIQLLGAKEDSKSSSQDSDSEEVPF